LRRKWTERENYFQ